MSPRRRISYPQLPLPTEPSIETTWASSSLAATRHDRRRKLLDLGAPDIEAWGLVEDRSLLYRISLMAPSGAPPTLAGGPFSASAPRFSKETPHSSSCDELNADHSPFGTERA